MSEENGLPKGWVEASVGELCGFVTSGSRGWASHYSDEGAVFIRIGNLDHEAIGLDMRSIRHVRPPAGAESDRTCVRSQDILVSVTADVGMIGVVPDGFGAAYINQHIALCRPLNGLYSPYIAWFLTSRRGQKQFKDMQRGATKVGLGLNDVRNATVPIAPLPEQHRIVEKIEELFSDLDAGVASLQRAKANLKRYRASVLKSAVEGRLTEEWRKDHPQTEDGQVLLDRILRERREKWEKDQLSKFREKGKEPSKNWESKYEEPSAPDTSELPELPEGWVWGTMSLLAERTPHAIGAGPFGTIFKARDFRPTGIPIIFLRHVKAGEYSTRKPGFMATDVWHRLFKEEYSVFGGELLVTKLGEPPGTACIYPSAIGPAMVTPDVIQMRVRADVADTRFLMHYMNSQIGQAFTSGKAFGTTRPRLTLPLFKELPVFLPPLAEQEQIVALVEERLSQIDSAEKTIDAELTRAKRLRQSILKQAFEGKLVPQNPKDEPASVLLERIKASREAEQPKKKTKKVKAK
jgi:type I restriction enzyme S subunit